MPNQSQSSNRTRNHYAKKFSRLNIVLSFFIVILLITLAIRFTIILSDQDSTSENDSIKNPLPTKPIINTHDHIDTMSMLDKWLSSQRQCNVSSTIMVGSPNSTFWGKPKEPYIKYLENNELIIEMAQKTNGEIIAFPTLNPKDENNLDLLKDYLSRGARGLNLWTGHHGTLEGSWGETTLYDWLGPLNRTDMYPIYKYCQAHRIPIIWSNNLGIREIRNNLWSILEKFPNMIIKIPHFGICFRTYNLPIIEQFLDNYTGLYTCFSWGHPDFVMEKFENISTVRNEAIKNFFTKYQDRIMFATDIVPTHNARKTVEWMRRHTQVYIDVLEKENYHVDILNFTPDGRDFIADYRGLNLSENILEKIYYNNTIKFLNGKKWNESLKKTSNARSGAKETIKAYEDYNYLSNVVSITRKYNKRLLMISESTIIILSTPPAIKISY